MIRRTKMILLTGAGVLVLAGVGTGIAFAHGASPPSPTLSGAALSSAAPASQGMGHGHGHGRPGWHGGHGRHGGPLDRIEHGEATVDTADHGYQVVDLQRGVVASANSGQLTVRSADGFSATYVVDNSTKVHKGRKSGDISQVLANDRVTVVATKAGGTATATRISDIGPAK